MADDRRPAAPRLRQIRQQLLAEGLPARRVRRVVGELRDHRADLITEGVDAGLPWVTARAAADERLGATAALAAGAIRQYRRESHVGRHPFLYFVVGPLPVLFFAWIAVFVPLYRLSLWTGPVDHLDPHLPALTTALSCGVPALVCGLYHRDRWRAAAGWRLVPGLLVATTSLFLSLHIRLQVSGLRGVFALGMVARPHPFQCLVPLTVTLGLAWWDRRRHRRRFTPCAT